MRRGCCKSKSSGPFWMEAFVMENLLTNGGFETQEAWA